MKKMQIGMLVALGAVLWLVATIEIRLRPAAFLDPLHGTIRFIVAPLAGWISVWLCKFIGRLSPEQLLPGVALVGTVAMMIDGAALQWFSRIYGPDEKTLRLAAAWLLWGYGAAFAVAVIWSARKPRCE